MNNFNNPESKILNKNTEEYEDLSPESKNCKMLEKQWQEKVDAQLKNNPQCTSHGLKAKVEAFFPDNSSDLKDLTKYTIRIEIIPSWPSRTINKETHAFLLETVRGMDEKINEVINTSVIEILKRDKEALENLENLPKQYRSYKENAEKTLAQFEKGSIISFADGEERTNNYKYLKIRIPSGFEFWGECYEKSGDWTGAFEQALTQYNAFLKVQEMTKDDPLFISASKELKGYEDEFMPNAYGSYDDGYRVAKEFLTKDFPNYDKLLYKFPEFWGYVIKFAENNNLKKLLELLKKYKSLLIANKK